MILVTNIKKEISNIVSNNIIFKLNIYDFHKLFEIDYKKNELVARYGCEELGALIDFL